MIPINCKVQKPYFDLRSGVRAQAMRLKYLDLFKEKGKIVNTKEGGSIPKNLYYDLLTNANGNYNKLVLINFKMTGSLIFREFLKSLNHIVILDGDISGELSEEFNPEIAKHRDHKFNCSCEFFFSIKLFYLIKLLAFMKVKVPEFYEIYGKLIINSIDEVVFEQIKIEKVFSGVIEKVIDITEFSGTFDSFKDKDEVSIGDAMLINSTEFYRYQGFEDYLGQIDYKNAPIPSNLMLNLHFKELSMDSNNCFLRNSICNFTNLSEREKQIFRLFLNAEKKQLADVLPCKGRPDKCIDVAMQLCNVLDNSKKPCPIFIEKADLVPEGTDPEYVRFINDNKDNEYRKMYESFHGVNNVCNNKSSQSSQE